MLVTRKKWIATIFIACLCAATVVGIGAYLYVLNLNDNDDDDDDDRIVTTLTYTPRTSPLIINHTHSHLANLTSIPEKNITAAKSNLHIAYFHTSHGSQLTSGGMNNLDAFMSDTDLYEYNSDGSGGELHLFEPDDDDGYLYGVRDLSDYVDGFDDTTRSFLGSNSGYNVVMWSWCSMETNLDNVDTYLSNMNSLEHEYPSVQFVYMTGHLNGGGEEGAVHIANERIRDYCITNNKILYDFANIESFDPDDNYWLDRYADDNCTYDDGNDGTPDGNWAVDWQDDPAHTEGAGEDWYECWPAHSQHVNGNMKAYAAWCLFASLAGWKGYI